MLKWEHSEIILTFIKVLFVIKIFVLSFFEWLLKTGFTVIHLAVHGFIHILLLLLLLLQAILNLSKFY